MNCLVPGITGRRFWETNNPFLTKESLCVLPFRLLQFTTSEAAEGTAWQIFLLLYIAKIVTWLTMVEDTIGIHLVPIALITIPGCSNR